MSIKLPISDEHEDFEIYQEMFDNQSVFLKLPSFAQQEGAFTVKNGHLTIALPLDTMKRIAGAWISNEHLFETEFQDLVSSIEELLSDLEETESPKPRKAHEDD